MSLPAVLEKLILRGLAEYDTWSFGTAGAGTLRLSKESFIIVTDFDFHHFVDEKPQAGTPATIFTIINPDDDTLDINLEYDIEEIGFFYLGVLDPLDVPTSQADFQAALDSVVTGWTVVISFTGTEWDISITTTTPGTAYNGIVPTVAIDVAGSVTPGEFAGGGVVATTSKDLLDRAIHQLEFRQKGKRYSWIIPSDLQLYAPQTGSFYGNVTGCFQKNGLYMPFTENVQIGIVQVPQVDLWSVSYQKLDPKSNEPVPPGGYGFNGAGASLNVVAQVIFDAGGAAKEQYIPVTEDRSSIALLKYTPQFKVDYTDARKLNSPKDASGFTNQGAGRRYPIMSIGYVRVNMKWEQFKNELEQWIRQ